MKKVYLKTPEAIIKALKDGKTIKNEHGYSYELKDNFIIQKILGKIRSINTTIFLDEDYYIDEEEPLKIEVGKFYKTRDGRKAFVYEKIKFDYPKPFCVVKAGKLDSYNVNADGKQEDNERPSDIVAPWEE